MTLRRIAFMLLALVASVTVGVFTDPYVGGSASSLLEQLCLYGFAFLGLYLGLFDFVLTHMKYNRVPPTGWLRAGDVYDHVYRAELDGARTFLEGVVAGFLTGGVAASVLLWWLL